NNPAAAASRAAAQLRETVETVQSFMCELSHVLTPEEWQELLGAEQEATKRLANAPQLDSLARSDREEALAGWLEQRGIAEGWNLAPNLVSADLEVDWLTALAGKLSAPSHPAALRWLETRLNLHLLLKSVEQSSRRVSELVKAMKAYSYVDRSPMQEID